MSVKTNVPVTIPPDALERVAELGFQAELEQMIEYAHQAVPQLVSIEVLRFIRYDEDSPDGLSVTATTAKPWRKDSDLQRQIARWAISTFPPEVLQHMTLGVVHETSDDAG